MWAPFPRLFPLDCSFAHESWLKFCGRIIISFGTRCFSRRRSAFERRRKDLFPLPRGTRTEPFLVTFFFFLFFILARYVRFFSGTRAANWNIKSASVMMRWGHDARFSIARTKSASLSLSLFARRKRLLALLGFCSFFVILISGSILWKRYLRSKKQQIGYSFSSSSRNATDVWSLFSAVFLSLRTEGESVSRSVI